MKIEENVKTERKEKKKEKLEIPSRGMETEERMKTKGKEEEKKLEIPSSRIKT